MEKLRQYLDSAKSVYHGVALLKQELEDAGYVALPESASWELQPGGKYYLTRNGASLIAFRIPARQVNGFMMSAAHSDRPTFKMKENGELKGTYTRLSVEKYGGMLMAPWLDRPLSLAGRVLVKTDSGIQSRLLDIDRDLLMIPNVAIHMNRKANDGYAFNPAVDMLPLMGDGADAGELDRILTEAAGGEILGHDLYLYVREKSSVWGLKNQFLSAPAIDNLVGVWCCAQGFLRSRQTQSVPLFCTFDSEEVGSNSMQGAGSDFLRNTLKRICRAMDWEFEAMLAQSFLVSVDNVHGVHPNHPEYADPQNAPVLNQGMVMKFNANQRYTTDGVSAAVFRSVCQKAEVPVQIYYNRADIAGGATLGYISITHVSVPSVDVGIPQLAMHSCYETVGVGDIAALTDAMTGYYNTSLQSDGDGSYRLA